MYADKLDLSALAHHHRPVKTFLLHRPGVEIEHISPETFALYNWSAVPDADRYCQEYEDFVSALTSLGAETVFLGDVLKHDAALLEATRQCPNLVFQRDLSVIGPQGYVEVQMGLEGREKEPSIVSQALRQLGVKCVGSLQGHGSVEGGDMAFFDGDSVLVGEDARATPAGLKRFEALMKEQGLSWLLQLRCPPGVVHIDGFLVFVDRDLAIVDSRKLNHRPARLTNLKTGDRKEVDVARWLQDRGVTLIDIDTSRHFMGANVVMVLPRHVVGYDWNEEVFEQIENHGGRAIGVPGQELSKGCGGPHCMTVELERH